MATVTGRDRLAWLQEFVCQPEDYRAVCKRPFRITMPDGSAWDAATDAFVIVAFPAGGVVPEPLSRRDAELGARVAGWIAEISEKESVALAELRTFAGEPQKIAKRLCGTCHGRKTTSCECECGHRHAAVCPDCEGSGTETVEPDPRYGVVFGVPLNLDILAQALDGAEGETVGLMPNSPIDGVNSRLGIIAADRRAIVVGVRALDRTDGQSPKDWPHFPEA